MLLRKSPYILTPLVAALVSLGASEVQTLAPQVPLASVFLRQAVILRFQVRGEQRPTVVLPPTGRDRFVVSVSRRSDEGWSVTVAYVPDRTGKQWVPAVEVRSGPEVSKSLPSPLEVRPVPSLGRPVDFAGGVGAIEAHAEVEPARVTEGDRFTYRVRFTGPGAIGVTSVSAEERVSPLAFDRVDGPSVNRRADPPESSFVWTLRALQAGTFRIPASTISTFDPNSRRFLPQIIPGVEIEVLHAPVLSARTVLEDSEPDTTPNLGARWWTWAVAGVFALLLMAAYGLSRRRKRPARRDQVAAHQARALERASEDEEVAHQILVGLTLYLATDENRDRGPLTPPEAIEAIKAVTGDPELGVEAGRLVGLCDRSLYGQTGAVASLRSDAIRFFRSLAAKPTWD